MDNSERLQGCDRSATYDYKFLYDHAACGLLSFDMTGKIYDMNQTLLTWTGLEHSAVRNLAFAGLLEKGSQLYFQLFVEPLLSMHKEVKEISLKIKGDDGDFQCLFNARIIGESEHSQDTLVHAAIFKVVDRKKFEDELRLRKEKAEFETQQKTDRLNKVAADQSHLVRAPLANVLGLIALLEGTGTDETSKELLIMLKESAKQLDRIVTEIVDTANE